MPCDGTLEGINSYITQRYIRTLVAKNLVDQVRNIADIHSTVLRQIGLFDKDFAITKDVVDKSGNVRDVHGTVVVNITQFKLLNNLFGGPEVHNIAPC